MWPLRKRAGTVAPTVLAARPSFFADWGRHSLGVAIGKRWGSFELEGTTYKYRALLALAPAEQVQLLVACARSGDELGVCLAFESIAIAASGDAQRIWATVLHGVEGTGRQADAVLLPLFRRKYLDDSVDGLAAARMDPEMAKVVGDACAKACSAGFGAESGRILGGHAMSLWPWETLASHLTTAVKGGEDVHAEMVLHAMSLQHGGQPVPLLLAVIAIATALEEATGAAVVSLALRGMDADVVKSLTLDAHGSFLVGKAYCDLAVAAKGVDKSKLQDSKKRALHHLGEARQKCQDGAGSVDVDPYRAAAVAAALTASVAAAYEAAAYLQWKGTRTAALAE